MQKRYSQNIPSLYCWVYSVLKDYKETQHDTVTPSIWQSKLGTDKSQIWTFSSPAFRLFIDYASTSYLQILHEQQDGIGTDSV